MYSLDFHIPYVYDKLIKLKFIINNNGENQIYLNK